MWLNNLKKRGRTGNGMVGVSIMQEDHKGEDWAGGGGKARNTDFSWIWKLGSSLAAFSRKAQDKWHSG